MPIGTIVMLVFSIGYLAYFVGMTIYTNKKGGTFRYKPFWLLIAVGVLIFAIYCLVTGTDITQFIH